MVLKAAQDIYDAGYISALPATAAAARTSVAAAIQELGSDPKVNSMAEALLADATDFITDAILNYETANQSAVSASGSSANADAQLDVASAGKDAFEEKRAAANEAAINEAQQAVLGAKNATAGSEVDALDAANDAFANAKTAVSSSAFASSCQSSMHRCCC